MCFWFAPRPIVRSAPGIYVQSLLSVMAGPISRQSDGARRGAIFGFACHKWKYYHRWEIAAAEETDGIKQSLRLMGCQTTNLVLFDGLFLGVGMNRAADDWATHLTYSANPRNSYA